MRESAELIRVPMGESGRIDSFDQKQNDLLVQLYVAGERRPPELAKQIGVNTFSVLNALRNPRTLAAINAEVKARAILLKADALDSAARDLQFGNGRERMSAREFIRSMADGDVNININNVNSWDPTKDEELWEKGKKFFQEHGRAIARATVAECLEAGDDLAMDGNG